MARAIAQRLRWKESLGLKDHFKGLVPATYQEALEAMAEKAGLKLSARHEPTLDAIRNSIDVDHSIPVATSF